MSQKQNTAPVSSHEQRAREFLAQSTHFRLGHLPTESRHPKTTRLSQLATSGKAELIEAIHLLKEVELDALRALSPVESKIEAMALEIEQTLKTGGRIFLCGCGATGRLSLSLETLWREECARLGRRDLTESVIAFMAGGDYAMVRSIENFEDHPEFGSRQLHDLGFHENDLLIGTTEGGETPFVIGAIEEASRASQRKPYMLFCNPADVLAKTIDRSRRAIESPRIHSIAIETGPMALAGSTRLQATTALMLATGAALFSTIETDSKPQTFITEFTHALQQADLTGLAPLIETESAVYAGGGLCLHRSSRHAITVLTDTTERSPTFSLQPFENVLDPKQPLAWTYLVHGDSKTAMDAWQKILGRAPRALDWSGFRDKYGVSSLPGFDFSPASEERRRHLSGTREFAIFEIEGGERQISLRIKGTETRIPRAKRLLNEHLLLKIAFNISSTLAMGRLGRFSSNLMLYVRAANNKLVDRAIRYIRILLDDAGVREFSYDEICLELFATTADLAPDEPAVWRTFERLRARARQF